MREIIFRGKAVIDFEIEQVCEFWERKVLENGNWIQGDLIWNNGIPFIVHGVIEANDEYISLEWWMPVDPETVGQYTGLNDNNGKMIFEGDVVFAGYGEYYQGTHEHSTTIIIDMSNYDALNALCNANVVEVIGNIHDQKEDV